MQFDDVIKLEPQMDSLLANMPAEIRTRCVVKNFPAQSRVVKKEDRVEYVYILIKGELKVINEFENGSIYIFSNILPLSFIGELEVLSGERTFALTIEAFTDSVAIRLPAEDFEKWLESDPRLLLMTARILAKKMYPTSAQNGIVLFRPGISKVQSFIINTYREKSPDGGALLIAQKRQQIADEIGIGVKTIHRSIQKLKQDGLITLRKGKIHITNDQYLKILSIVTKEYRDSTP